MTLRTFFYSITSLLALIILSCVSEKDRMSIPSGILTPEEMRLVLADFARAESAAVLNVKNIPLNKVDSVYAFNPLIENKIRKTQFDSSLKFYSENPELYKQIYDSVVVTLSQMKSLKNTKASPNSK